MKNPKTIRNRAIVSLLVVVAIGLIITFANLLRTFLEFTDSDMLDIIISVVEAGGLLVSLIVAARQLGDSKEIARAQFLTELNKSFVENADYASVYNALQDCRDGVCPFKAECDEQKGACLLNIKKGTVSNYLTFFETINLLIEDGVLTLEVIDNLFAYRFFLAVHSKFIQESKIIPQPENFVNIFKLERKWLDYRHKIGKIPKPGTVYAERCLETVVDAETYKMLVKDIYKK